MTMTVKATATIANEHEAAIVMMITVVVVVVEGEVDEEEDEVVVVVDSEAVAGVIVADSEVADSEEEEDVVVVVVIVVAVVDLEEEVVAEVVAVEVVVVAEVAEVVDSEVVVEEIENFELRKNQKMIFFVLLFVALFRTQEVSHDQENNLVIDNKDFSSVTKDCLKITNSQSVTIKNSRFKSCFGVGIVIEGCTNVNIENSYVFACCCFISIVKPTI